MCLPVGDAIRFSPMKQEHAYWYAPPHGIYTVEISCRATCGNGGSATWHVVIDIDNEKTEFSGTIKPGEIALVGQFEVSSWLMRPIDIMD